MRGKKRNKENETEKEGKTSFINKNIIKNKLDGRPLYVAEMANSLFNYCL